MSGQKEIVGVLRGAHRNIENYSKQTLHAPGLYTHDVFQLFLYVPMTLQS